MKEVKLLMSQLPPSGIYFAGFEDRSNLARALIEGPSHTPYAYSLFMFDICLTSTYPNDPPDVYFHCLCSEKPNPNLYVDGNICLSLLNTWNGEGNERWVPESSNILQVLLSLRSLVLNEEPYFNEAGYDIMRGTEGGKVNSLYYNEHAFIMSLQYSINMFKSAPAPFSSFIKSYYLLHKNDILSECDKRSVYGSDGFRKVLMILRERFDSVVHE
jgi:ubiquitin-conjugating enzyme E2 O